MHHVKDVGAKAFVPNIYEYHRTKEADNEVNHFAVCFFCRVEKTETGILQF